MKRLGLMMLFVTLSCAPPGVELKGDAPPKAEDQDIVPVGGYEILAGTWDTVRMDDVYGQKHVRLQIEMENGMLTGKADESSVRIRCQPNHRTCVGTWSHNTGRGGFLWTFGTDFASFTGSYDGTINGGPVGKTSWTGTKQ